MREFRVKRRGRRWGVQERAKLLWRWIGPYGSPALGFWDDSAGALWYANLCERVERRRMNSVVQREE